MEEWKIVYWKDKYSKSWIIQVLDEYGNEVVSSIQGNVVSRDYEIKMFKFDYRITKVEKVA